MNRILRERSGLWRRLAGAPSPNPENLPMPQSRRAWAWQLREWADALRLGTLDDEMIDYLAKDLFALATEIEDDEQKPKT